MNIEEVSNYVLPDGSTYRGWGYYSKGSFIPHGAGKREYNDFYIVSTFRNSLPDGPTLISHHLYMHVIQYNNNQGNGWGMCVEQGKLKEFGYYVNNQLKVDVTDFALWFFSYMTRYNRNDNLLKIKNDKDTHDISDLFIGCKDCGTYYNIAAPYMGYHFMPDGSVWIGETIGRIFTGTLIHFRPDGQIECGNFLDGELIETIDLQVVIDSYFLEQNSDEQVVDIHFGYWGEACGLKALRRQFKNISPIVSGHNYFLSNPYSSFTQNAFENKYIMFYYLEEIDFDGSETFFHVKKETWVIGDKLVITPHGSFLVKDAVPVYSASFVGVELTVKGSLRLDNFSCSDGTEDDNVDIEAFSIVHKSGDSRVWVYGFDSEEYNIVNFRGTDEEDGLPIFTSFLKRVYRK
ncbi:MAG: hypothetical protein ACI37U_11660 [Bacteroides sp.]